MSDRNSSDESVEIILSALHQLPESLVFLNSNFEIMAKNDSAKALFKSLINTIEGKYFDFFPVLNTSEFEGFLSDPEKNSLTWTTEWDNGSKLITHQLKKAANGFVVSVKSEDTFSSGREINYDALFEKMPEGVVYEDAVGIPIRMNPAAQALIGLTIEQLQGFSPIDPGWHVIYPDGTPFPVESHPPLVSLRTGLPVKNEVMGIFNPELEEYKWISLNSTPEFRPGENKPYQVFATFIDITEQIVAEKKLKAQSELLNLLVNTSTSFINIPEEKLQETIQLSLEKLGEFVRADRIYVFDYQPDEKTFTNSFKWCSEGITPQIEFLNETTLGEMSLWTENLLKGEITYLEDVSALEAADIHRQILEPQGIKSLLAMPIWDNSQCSGFVGLDSVRKQHSYSDNEFNLLRIFTGILANVTNRLKKERQLKERVKEFNTIYQVTKITIQDDLSEDEILEKISQLISLGFYEPNETSVEIRYLGDVFTSTDFKASSNFIHEKIFLSNKEVGDLKVFIPENKKFLPEEHTLIQAICNVLGQHFESKSNLNESKRNELQLKNLLNSQTSYVLRTNLEGRHTYWNEKFKDEFGWIYGNHGLDNEDALQSICDYHHGRTLEVVRNCIYTPGKIFTVELDKPGKDGKVITTLWEFVALTDSQGNATEIQCMGINISDRKKTENQLKESETRLRSLLESQTNYVIRTDLNGRHTFWNKKFEEDFGFIYPTRGLASSDSLTSICEYDKDKAREVVIKCLMEPGKIIQVELDKPLKSGKTMTTLWDFVCLTDSNGVPYEMQCVGIDITERKESEFKLKESEEKYRFLFEESPDGYLVIKDGKFLDCNKSTLSIMRCQKEDIIGKTPSDISPLTQPSGRLSKDLEDEIIRKTLDSGYKQFEWVHTRMDGSEFLVEIKLSKIIMNDEEVIFTTWKDITEKRATEQALIKSEKRFSQIAEHTGSVIWEVDKTGLYTFLGPVAKRVYGYSPEEMVGKMHYWEIVPENFRKEVITVGERNLREGTEIVDWENPIRRKDGELIWVSSFGAAIRDEKGEIIGYRGADYDITSRKIAELELMKFRVISDKATYGTAITEFGTRKITYCNEAFAKMHGYIVEELIGKHVVDLHTTEQLEFYFKNIYPEYEKNKEYSLKEFGRKRKDGSTFQSLVTAKLFFDENGNPLFNAATVVDISQQKINEEKIKDQNIRLKAIIDALPDILYVMDTDGNYLEYFASKLENGIGDFSGLVGKNLQDVFSPEDFKFHLDKIKNAVKNNRIETYEYPGILGFENRFFESRLVPMTENRVLRFVREITERKRNESEIRKLNIAIEQSPVAIIITDLKGNLTYMSPAFLKMTGYSSEDLYGKSISLIKSGLTDQHVYADLWSTISSGKNWQHEWMNRKKSGELFWENISITPIMDDRGNIKNYLAVKQDITERKNYEEEIIELNQNLEKRIHERTKELENSNRQLEVARNEANTANEAKSEFLSRMSHELRTPMNSILGFAQLLELSHLSEAQTKNLDYILKSGNHLLQLINEVLDIAKIEAGKVSVSLEPIELCTVISEVADSVMHFAESKSLTINLPDREVNKIYVLADLQRLKQILINLLNNAIKYNREKGAVWIKVEIIHENDGNKFVRIFVIDNGIGISAENLPKLFRPFERIGTNPAAIEGTGLGLSVVEKLTHLMRGKVGVESTLGVGSKFWVELPASEAHPQSLPDTIENEDVENNNQFNQGTLLLVEDNVSNIELIQELLRTLKPNVKVINTMYGKESIQLAKAYKPSLILLDLNLPDIPGSKVLEALKSDPETKDLPILVVSADATSKQMENILSKGANQYITKPINVGQLIKIFDQYLKYSTYE